MGIDAIFIAPGDYEIGDNDIPHAGPRHMRRVSEGFWIERQPVGYQAFIDFVIGGGYLNTSRWAKQEWPADALAVASVDARCHEVCRASQTAIESNAPFSGPSPVMGLTWFEASTICQMTGARLPFETEWEIAIKTLSRGRHAPPAFEEWTADAFSSQFWRADFSRRGVPFSPGMSQVTVRGSAPTDMFRHVAARRGREPTVARVHCGFRRVWDVDPSTIA